VSQSSIHKEVHPTSEDNTLKGDKLHKCNNHPKPSPSVCYEDSGFRHTRHHAVC